MKMTDEQDANNLLLAQVLLHAEYIIKFAYPPFGTQVAFQVARQLQVVDKRPPLLHRSQRITIVELDDIAASDWIRNPVAADGGSHEYNLGHQIGKGNAHHVLT